MAISLNIQPSGAALRLSPPPKIVSNQVGVVAQLASDVGCRYNGAWQTAVIAAGYPHLLVHDFRRSAVKNLEHAGVPRSLAMELTGHETESIYARYAIADDDARRRGVEKLVANQSAKGDEALGAGTHSSWAQNGPN